MKRIMIVDDDVAVTNYLMVALVQTDRFEPVVLHRIRIRARRLRLTRRLSGLKTHRGSGANQRSGMPS